MDDLILRVLSGESDDAERKRLALWRAQAPENEVEYRRLERVWELSAMGAPAVPSRAVPDPVVLIRQAEAVRSSSPVRIPAAPDRHPDRAPPPPPAASPRPTGRGAPKTGILRWAALLAALLVPAALALGLARSGGFGPGPGADSDTVLPSASTIQLATASHEMTTLDLSDGSQVRLGPNSRMEITEGPERITVYLEGRAFFGVSPDASRRFVVTTPLGEAAVLGTRFEVRSEEDEFRVLVVEGAVEISAGEAEAELRAGEMGRSVQGSRPATSTVDDLAAQLEWIGNALFFQATPLTTALEEVEARFDVDIRLAEPSLAEQTVTASFVDQEAKEVLAVLCTIVGAHCRWDTDETSRLTLRMGIAGAQAEQAGEPHDP